MTHLQKAKEILKVAENIAYDEVAIGYDESGTLPLFAAINIAQTHAVLAIAEGIQELTISVQLLRGSFGDVYDNVAQGDA